MFPTEVEYQWQRHQLVKQADNSRIDGIVRFLKREFVENRRRERSRNR